MAWRRDLDLCQLGETQDPACGNPIPARDDVPRLCSDARAPVPCGTLEARRRALGVIRGQVAKHLGWTPGSLTKYLTGPGDCRPVGRQPAKVSPEVEPAQCRLKAHLRETGSAMGLPTSFARASLSDRRLSLV